MEKVKLTKEQAAAIEEIKDIDYAINIQAFKKRPDSPLASLETSELARALFVGYEVEPEFKVGDWVVSVKTGFVGTILDIFSDGMAHLSWGGSVAIKNLRHATPEEIQQEKERRFWARHGREVWELKCGDILSFHESLEVYNIEEAGHNFIFVNGANGKVRYELEQVKKLLKIACFAEDRKDIGDN